MNAPAPVHPGRILLTEVLEPLGISQYALAKAAGLPLSRVNAIVHGRRAITADTGLRLSRALGTCDMFWINMQARYDADVAFQAIASDLEKITPIAKGAATPA
ncbi:MAG: HigA family addiction module antitoxin [Gordonia sp. (in: high G+C Gram-positive bacteria)]